MSKRLGVWFILGCVLVIVVLFFMTALSQGVFGRWEWCYEWDSARAVGSGDGIWFVEFIPQPTSEVWLTNDEGANTDVLSLTEDELRTQGWERSTLMTSNAIAFTKGGITITRDNGKVIRVIVEKDLQVRLGIKKDGTKIPYPRSWSELEKLLGKPKSRRLVRVTYGP